MADIVLTTLNAKYIHAAFGLRYLFANLGDLQSRALIAEFDINQRPLDIAEALLAREPKIIGFGVYIWNVTETTEVIAAIRRVRPQIKIILGGPEVSYETEGQPIVELANHVITGEADLKFAEVCRVLLGGTALTPTLSHGEREPRKKGSETSTGPLDSTAWGTEGGVDSNLQLLGAGGLRGRRSAEGVCLPKIIPAPLPEFSAITLPYDYYTASDLAHRIIYVEASRGCPFTCEFCLSSLDIPVRQVPLDGFLGEMQKLLDRGLKQFKFVDRTFNLNVATSKAILEFFHVRYEPGMFIHFEMIPDRLPAELRAIIARFPSGALQFEVGIQTFNPDVGMQISRRQNYERLADNFQFLRRDTGVHIHADLIVGLPGETLESFASGFNQLVALDPQEIQVGILKRLRGTPIGRHDTEWQMTYTAYPPYEILQNKLLDFGLMQRLRRFAKYWDLVGNSGNFMAATPLIWAADAGDGPGQSISPFDGFLRFSDWLYGQLGRTDSIALVRLAAALFDFITGVRQRNKKPVAEIFWRDWQQAGRRDPPDFIREFLTVDKNVGRDRAAKNLRLLPKRQARHGEASTGL